MYFQTHFISVFIRKYTKKYLNKEKIYIRIYTYISEFIFNRFSSVDTIKLLNSFPAASKRRASVFKLFSGIAMVSNSEAGLRKTQISSTISNASENISVESLVPNFVFCSSQIQNRWYFKGEVCEGLI